MILLFLGSMRATAAVLLSIPISALATFVILYMMGSTVNTMILGGMALAFSRVIDNSVISLENIYRHLEMGASPAMAAEQGGAEVTLAVLAATLVGVVDFFPVTFLFGVSKFLFSALALAFCLSLLASFVVAMTVIPLFCSRFLKAMPARPRHAGEHGDEAWRLQRLVQPAVQQTCWMFTKRAVRARSAVPALTVALLLGVFVASLADLSHSWPGVFPAEPTPANSRSTSKLPTGTRIEVTDEYVAKIERHDSRHRSIRAISK